MTYLSDVLPRPSRAARILGSDTAITESTISVPPGSTRTAMLPPEPMRTETLSRRRWTSMFAFAASRLIASTGPADAGRAANAKTLVRHWRVVILFMVFLFFLVLEGSAAATSCVPTGLPASNWRAADQEGLDCERHGRCI